MPRIVGTAILAVGIVCAPVIFAGAPPGQAQPQSRPLSVDPLGVGPASVSCNHYIWRDDGWHCMRNALTPMSELSPVRRQRNG